MNDEEDKLIKKIVRSEWSQIVTVIITVSGLFFWSFSITNSSVEAIRQDIKGFNEAIRQDIKDFHGRLCTLEEKYYHLKIGKNEENK